MPGWIKLHRCLFTKPIWLQSSTEHASIMITLLAMANHEKKEWEWNGRQFKAIPGQFVTSVASIISKCPKSISRQNVRSALERFKKYEFLTYEATKTGMLITIVNWGIYQKKDDDANQDTNQQPTNDQPTGNQQPTTNKNDKNVKNDKKNIYTPQFETFWLVYPLGGRANKEQTAKNFSTLVKNGVLEGSLIQAAENYAADIFTEQRTEYIKVSSNFVGKAAYYVDYLDENWKPKQVVKPVMSDRDLKVQQDREKRQRMVATINEARNGRQDNRTGANELPIGKGDY